MPERRRDVPALARLTFREGAPLRIEFEFAAEPDPPIDPVVIYDDKAIDEAWDRAGRALSELAGEARGHAAHPKELWQPLKNLRAASLELGQRLFDWENDRWTELQRAFTEARLGWHPFDWRNIPVVDVIAHGNGYPVELLPAFLPPDGWRANDIENDIENDIDLMRTAEYFLGFTAVVRRIAPERELQPATLANDPTLPIQLFRYREVAWDGSTPTVGVGAGFAREEAFLASLPDLTVDGPWPTDEPEADVKQRVIDALFDANQRLTPGTGGHPAAALAHFACHCTVKQHSEKFELLLSTQSGEPRKVTLADITAGYGTRGAARYLERPERAAVIFNACGTSMIDPLSSLSFQRWFLRNRHPAFLGTQAAIPDEIAADFAELLYGFLLGGFSFGEAVVLARRQLLLAAKSPLGILYFLHGNDRLEVQRERPSALPKGFQ
jgi:hypothetical protein